jgi:hypothetical protein
MRSFWRSSCTSHISNMMVYLHEALHSITTSMWMHRVSPSIHTHHAPHSCLAHSQLLCYAWSHMIALCTKGSSACKTSRSSQNSKLGLQYPKCSLHMFPSCGLSIMESNFFLIFGAMNWLDKCRPLWLYSIRKIISHVVCVAIFLKRNQRRLTICKLGKNRWSLENVHVIAGT